MKYPAQRAPDTSKASEALWPRSYNMWNARKNDGRPTCACQRVHKTDEGQDYGSWPTRADLWLTLSARRHVSDRRPPSSEPLYRQ